MTKLKISPLLLLPICVGLVLAFPVKVGCGTANFEYQMCGSPPDKDGYLSSYYEIQPVVASIFESLEIVINFPFKYSSGIYKNDVPFN